MPIEIPIRPVKSIIVESGKGLLERSFSGTLQSSQQTSFSFRVSGALDDILVSVGDAVEQGQVIARLDPLDYELQVQKAKASLTEANSQERNSKANYERTKRLYEAGNSSRNDLDNARAAAEAAAASVQSSRKTLQLAQQDLAYTRLKSSGDCRIASIPADTGENVSAGTEVITATCGDSMEVKLDIPETFIGFVEKDTGVRVSFPAIPDRDFDGMVKEVGGSTIAGGTTFPVDILIPSSEVADLKSGLSADVKFSIDLRKDGAPAPPVVPSFSVGEDEQGPFVFVVESSGTGFKVSRTSVAIGELSDDGIEILSGLVPGQRVVTAGVSVLTDGTAVLVAD